MNWFPRTCLVLICGLLALAGRTTAAEPTAFALIKEGNRHVGQDAKDRVVQIRSEKSVGGLIPSIWYVVYYDPDATFKTIEVKFGAGQKLSVKRPVRVLEPIKGAPRELPREKLKIDSNQAIDIAKREPLLEKLTLTATRLVLERWDETPVWKVQLWAAELRDPKDSADIGEVFIDVETGKVVHRDLHIDRVD